MIVSLALALAVFAVPPQLSPTVVLERYRAALASLSEPRVLTFEYTVAQAGVTSLYQKHRIYRSGDRVRDEAVEVDGHTLKVPAVHISSGRDNRYAITRIAPNPGEYKFTFARSELTGRHWSYVFETAGPEAPFNVRSVTIDGLTFLPSKVTFESKAGDMTGKGTLAFAKADRYWLVQEANVEAAIAGERSAERILWRNYQFPESLPAGVFKA